MKPQSLQDAIKAAALKKKSRIESGQWKEPTVKQAKVTALDMKKAEKVPSNIAIGGSSGICTSVDTVLRKEMDMIKKQMLDLQASVASATMTDATTTNSRQPGNNNSSSDDDDKATNQQLQALRDEVNQLKEIIQEMKGLPQQMNRFRESVTKLIDHPNNPAQSCELEEIKNEVASLRVAMKKQKGELVRELDTALSKVEQQNKTIREQQWEIDVLRKQVTDALQKGKLATISASAEKTGGEATCALQVQQPQEGIMQPVSPQPTEDAVPSGPPKSILVSPRRKTLLTPSKKKNHLSSPLKKSTQSFESKNEEKAVTAPTKKTAVNDSSSSSDCDSDASPEIARPSSLPHIPKDDSDSSSENEYDKEDPIDKPKRTHRQNPRRFETQRAPERPQSQDDSDNSSSDEEGDGDIEIEIDAEEDQPQEQTGEGTGGDNFARRGSLDSVQTWDSVESAPRKKIISLLPHKSIDLYEYQRKDTILRKLMMKGKTPNMKVRKVHGKNLVFFSDRVYIPAPLRQKTLEFYWKKYRKQTPLIHLNKNCFWADMDNEWKRFDAEKRGKARTYHPVQLSIV